MLFSVLTRKGKVPRLNFHPPRSRPWLSGGGPWVGCLPCPGAFIQHPVWVFPVVPRPSWEGRSQLAAPSGPSPQTRPSSLREQGAQDPAGPQAPQATQMGAGSHWLQLMETATAIRLLRGRWGRGSLLLQGLGLASGLPWWGLWSYAGHSPQPVPRPLSSPVGPRPEGLEGPGEKAAISLIHLSRHSLPGGPLQTCWRGGTSNRQANGCVLTAAC